MSTSKELVELSELYTNITERKLYQGGNNQSWRNKGTDKDKEDAKKEGELEKVLTNLKNSKKDEKDDDKEEIKGPNITTSKSNNKSNTVDLTNTTNNKTDNKSNNNEKPPIKVDIKDKDGKVIGNKTIHSGSSEYKDASQGKGDVKAPSEMGTDVKGINVKTGNIVKTDKKEVKPEVKEVKPETYLGKDQGLLNKADWLKKTSRSPAAKSGAFSDDQRWAQQLKHRQWQKDNNRGKFKAKTKEVPSKFAANKEKDTFKRRDSKLVAKGLKPPTYNKNVKVQEAVGPRLVKRALKNIPTELAPAAFMSGVLNKAKGLADKNTFIKGAIDGATGTTKLLRKVVTPPKGRKLTPNVKSTERISQGGALAVRKPNIVQKAKDLAGDAKDVIKDKVKGAKEKLKNVKLKNPIPKPVTDYAVPVGVGVGIHKALNKEDFDAYDIVLSYLMETKQTETLEEANYVMMEMDGKTINEIRQIAEGMPQYVRDSIGRQYGTGKYKGQKYSIEDKKNVINWYSRIKA